jgi:hypothetical protein
MGPGSCVGGFERHDCDSFFERRRYCRRKRTSNFVEYNLYIVLKKRGSEATRPRIPALVRLRPARRVA